MKLRRPFGRAKQPVPTPSTPTKPDHDWANSDDGGVLGKVRQCRQCRLHQTRIAGGWIDTPIPVFDNGDWRTGKLLGWEEQQDKP